MRSIRSRTWMNSRAAHPGFAPVPSSVVHLRAASRAASRGRRCHWPRDAGRLESANTSCITSTCRESPSLANMCFRCVRRVVYPRFVAAAEVPGKQFVDARLGSALVRWTIRSLSEDTKKIVEYGWPNGKTFLARRCNRWGCESSFHGRVWTNVRLNTLATNVSWHPCTQRLPPAIGSASLSTLPRCREGVVAGKAPEFGCDANETD